MSNSIDWEHLARGLGLLRKDGESSGSSEALRALELIIGETALVESVEYYISGEPGSELARSVLWQLRSWAAMNHCYQIFKSSRPLDERRTAVELVRVVADVRALNWVDEFLKDPDTGIQLWGVGLLDQLLWSALVEPTAAERQLLLAETHKNAGVVERARFIREFLQSRTKTQMSPSHT
jgi:hypothetical protein